MRDAHVLALDAGTTSVRSLVFDADARVVGTAARPLRQGYPRPGWVEHDPHEILQGQVATMREALQAAGLEARDVAAVGIANQRETTILWDRRTGEPVHPAIVWQDRRTAPFCDELVRAGHGDLIRERTGLRPDPYFSGTKLRWLLDNVEGARERAARGDLAFGTVDTWLLWNLTGGAVHATDPSNASRTLLYDLRARDWSDEMAEVLGVPTAVLPEVGPSSGALGTVEADVLGVEVPVGGMAGDQQAALFGQACFRPGMVKNTYGTGSFLLMNTGSDAAPSDDLLTTVAWDVDGAFAYALEGSVFVSGAAVQWLRDGLGLLEDAAETEALARSLQGNDGVYLVPALAGLGAPWWDPRARGTIVGLTRGTTRAHLARAALEAAAYQSRDVVEAMRREAGADVPALRVDGGMTANRFLLQFQADVLGVPVELPAAKESTALGAAYLAGLAQDVWSSREDIAARWRLAERFTPEMDREEREKLVSGWHRAVQRSLGWAKGDGER